jgi:predicted alpha-1,2-mannosidase
MTCRVSKLAAVALAAAMCATVVAAPASAQLGERIVEDLARWVNPYVGTKPGGADHGTGGGAGNTFPGADVPFGMVQWSPDTVTHQHGGYFYDDNRIKGFSLTHLSGPGCSTYQDIPVMPFAGEVTTSPATDPNRYVSTFSHDNENISPGYYGVELDSGVGVELAVTKRSGIGRLSFPAGSPMTVLVNTSGSIAGADDAETIIGTDTISGWATSGRFCGTNHRYRVYFHAKFDRPFAAIGTWRDGSVSHGRATEHGGSLPKAELGKTAAPAARDTTVSGPGTGGFVTFDPAVSDTVEVRIGLSFVSLDGARGNLRAESGGHSFAQIAKAARASWNELLNRIKVTGGTDAERTTFYTALYHSLLQPNVFSDADGGYLGFDGRVHTVERGHDIYTNFSGWDVYRSEIQLLALIAPREMSDIARSMIAFAEQGGSWDRWTVAAGYTGVMVGDPYHIIVSTAFAFGARDFDASKALLLMLRGASAPTQGYQERPGLAEYQRLGYVPMGTTGVWGPAATTLEYTSADFAIAELARRLGDGATWDTFVKRAQRWQNLFNPGSGYLQPRNADGSFLQPFNPASGDGWVEGNGAQYTWMVPYNARGLFDAMGGNPTVVSRLDTFFTELNAGPARPFAFLGNEPNMAAPWLYNYAGAPQKTQAVARRAVNALFNPHPDGLVGNDDLGQMSSWYVWAAMGMYPVNPGRADLVLNGPLFDEVVVTRPTGVTLTIRADGAGTNSPYIAGLKVNGAESTRSWLPESFVEQGGTLEYRMSDTPDPTWGTAPTDAPPSFRDGEIGQRGYLDPGRIVVPAGMTGTAEVGAQDFSGAGATVNWSMTPPPGLSVFPSAGELAVPPAGRASRAVTVQVLPGTEEKLYRIPVSFTGPGGTELAGSVLQVLVAEPGSLRASFNNTGVSPDTDTAVANFDNVGFSYSANALAVAGVRPGETVTVDGLVHRWPATEAGEPDNVVAAGQTVALPAVPQGATRLALLGSATGGPASGQLTITYTDGSTQLVDIGFSDWTLGGGRDQVSFGNRIAASAPYRNVTSGGSQYVTTYVFATAPIELVAGKQVRSVSLPSAVQGGGLHVFAITAG